MDSPHFSSDYEMINYISLDTTCFIVENMSINNVLDILRLPHVDADGELISGLMSQLDEQFFTFNGVQFYIKRADLRYLLADALGVYGTNKINIAQYNNLFTTVFPSLRCYISGKGMNYCRQAFLDADTCVFDSFVLDLQDAYGDSCNFHFTRNDIAVDCINASQDLINDIYLKWNEAYQASLNDPGNRDFVFVNVGNGGAGRGLAFEPRVSGDQRTLYIGSKNSDCLMRIYDKYLQKIDFSGCFAFDCEPYFDGIDNCDIKNWTRFEVQFRNIRSQEFASSRTLLSPGSFLHFISNRFACCPRADCDGRGNIKSIPFPFWSEFFNKFVNAPITLNNHFVQLATSPLPRAQRNIRQVLRSLLTYFALSGMSHEDFHRFLDDQMLDVLNSRLTPEMRPKLLGHASDLACDGLDLVHVPAYFYDNRAHVFGFVSGKSIYFGKYQKYVDSQNLKDLKMLEKSLSSK